MNAEIPTAMRIPVAGMPAISTDARVQALIAAGAPVCVSVSGGKDSVATAVAVDAHLREVGHPGPRLLVHSDLGSIEWEDSLPSCRRTAERLGWELLVVARAAGGMMERFEQRWRGNVARYADLECLRLILPWSTPAMRYCTREMKGDVIDSALKRRFRDSDILTVTGIRRDESPGRSKRPVSSVERRMCRRGLVGVTWSPILEWTADEVFAAIAGAGIALHEAYRTYGSSRVSCSYCIMSSLADLEASASCARNAGSYRAIVDLEARSAFAFQGGRWLADVAPHLLDAATREAIVAAKAVAARRDAAQARLPRSLAYAGGVWPAALPDADEAETVASVRREVAEATGLALRHLTAEGVARRFRELVDARLAKAA